MSTQKKKDNLYLVINLGFRSIRLVLFDETGKKIIHNWYPVKTVMSDGFIEQDANEWVQKLGMLFSELVNSVPEVKSKLVAITVTSSAGCLVSVDKEGNPLHNCILISDTRAEKQAQRMLKNHSAFFDSDDSFLPLASYQLPKIVWFLENNAQVFENVHKFLSPNDFIIYKLTGKYVTDPLNASKFYYNESDSSHPHAILAEHKISVDKFPEVKPVGYVVGELRGDLRKKYGFSRKVVVVQTTYDALCAFWGSGVSGEGEASNVVGTVSSVRVLSGKKIAFKSNLLSQSFSIFGKYIVGGSNNIDGGVFEWAKGCFYGDSYPEKYIFNIMNDEATRSEIGARGLCFIPYLLGERAPFWDPHVRGAFFGLEKFHSRDDIVRSIFESSCFMIKDIMDEIERHGVVVNTLRMNGGASRLDLLSQLRADVLNKKVLVLKETESTALGAFLLMVHALGVIPSVKHFSDYVGIDRVYNPNLENHRMYLELFKFFKYLYASTKKVSKKRHALLSMFKDSGKRYEVENM